MKIIIFVRHDHLENLYGFLGGGERKTIKWHQERPGLGHYFMVSLDYNDFVKLDDK